MGILVYFIRCGLQKCYWVDKKPILEALKIEFTASYKNL